MLFVRSLIFTFNKVVSALIMAVFSLLTFPFPFHVRYRFTVLWARYIVWTLKIICHLDYKIEGTENIPNKAAIILAKHQSAWETIAFQGIFPPQTWVLKRELLWIPFFGWALALLKPVAINRKAGRAAIQQVIDQGKKRLDEGIWIMIFPEGTRKPPGVRGRYKPGGALLAESSGYSVVPVAHNAGEYWPRNAFTIRPGTIHVVVGPTILPKGLTASEINQRAESWIESTMARISTISYPLDEKTLG